MVKALNLYWFHDVFDGWYNRDLVWKGINKRLKCKEMRFYGQLAMINKLIFKLLLSKKKSQNLHFHIKKD